MVRFSTKETSKIVELYRAHECLWNPNNDYYRCRRMQRAACAAIAHEMNIEGFTAADVRTKLSILRGTYHIERKKERRFAQSAEPYVSKIKWLSIMDTFIPMVKDKQPSGNDSSSQNADKKSDGIFPEDSHREQNKSNSENVCVPNETEIEQSIRSITDTEVITVTPDMPALQSDAFAEKPIIKNGQPVSNASFVTVTPDILTVKAVSNSEPIPTTGIKSVQSVSNPKVITISPENRQILNSVSKSAVTTAPSGIQTLTSAPIPKLFALIPEGRTSNSVPNNNFIAITPANNQNIRYIGGNETLASRKRRHEEVSSNNDVHEKKSNSNNDVHQINNARPGIDECGQTEDEMGAFGLFVTFNLRKLSMQSALSAQAEILSVLTRYRLNDSAANLPSNQIVPYILTNGNPPTQNPVLLVTKSFPQEQK